MKNEEIAQEKHEEKAVEMPTVAVEEILKDQKIVLSVEIAPTTELDVSQQPHPVNEEFMKVELPEEEKKKFKIGDNLKKLLHHDSEHAPEEEKHRFKLGDNLRKLNKNKK